MRILKEDTLALIIDFQEKLVPVIHQNEVLLRNTEILIKGLQTLGIPMIVTQQYTKGIGMTVPALTEVFGENFSYEDKVTFSCADDTSIMSKITEMNRKNIIVCGVEAHICVQQTVIDLLALGYNVILVVDCIGSRKEKDMKIGIQRACLEGVIPTTYESVLFELTRVAKMDEFKKISALIK